MAFTQPRKFLTASEASEYLGGKCNRVTIIRLINSGQLRGKKLGKQYRILPEWLDEFMSKPDDISHKE